MSLPAALLFGCGVSVRCVALTALLCSAVFVPEEVALKRPLLVVQLQSVRTGMLRETSKRNLAKILLINLKMSLFLGAIINKSLIS